MSNRFGATSWDDVELNSKKTSKSNNKDSFLKLEQGSNIVRIITKPYEYLVHSYKAHKDDPGYGMKVMSSSYHGPRDEFNGASDPLMGPPYNLKPSPRWYIGVIDRKTQSAKIIDLSPSAFRGIQGLVRDEDWGDPSMYDIDIKVDKDGGPANYYIVNPKPKKPLSPSDLEIREGFDVESIERRCHPPTYEKVQERVDYINKQSKIWVAENAAKQQQSVEETAAPAAPVVSSSETQNASGFDFPPVN